MMSHVDAVSQTIHNKHMQGEVKVKRGYLGHQKSPSFTCCFTSVLNVLLLLGTKGKLRIISEGVEQSSYFVQNN